MADVSRISLPDLAGMSVGRRWLFLAALSSTFIFVLHLLSMPATVLIGTMAAGIVLAISGGMVAIPRPLFFFCQSIIGCMISRSISLDILRDIAARWPLFLMMVLSVSVICTTLGWLLAKSGLLPGTTAIWGISPGGALVMTMMSDEYGADSRLVAFMQYLRLVMVTLAASMVSSVWGEPRHLLAAAAVAGDFDWIGFGETIAMALTGMTLGVFVRVPAGPILFPMIVGSFLNLTGVVRIELPWWLLFVAYCVIGWSIGLRFTRAIVAHAVRAFPKIFATMIVVILFCGLIALLVATFADGIDPLTAYLATSPGGMDSIAIISATMGCNMSFVMAVQVTRFILVTLTSPPLATFVAKRSGLAPKKTETEASSIKVDK